MTPSHNIFAARVHKALTLQPKRIATGVHPSQAYKFCPIHHYHLQEAVAHVNDPDPEISAYAQETMIQEMRSFSPPASVYMKMGLGTAMHTRLQFYGGLAGIQVGEWECPECGHRVGSPEKFEYMPHSTRMGIDGPEIVADKCPQCGKNFRHPWPWLYVEPKIQIEEFNIYGKADGLWVVPDPQGRLFGVVDYKSCNDNSFREMIPLPQHKKQLQIYGYGLAQKYELDFVALVYENKDTSEIREFYFEPDPEYIRPFLIQAAVAKLALEQGRPPAPRHRVCDSPLSAKAKKCQFAEVCFKEG